MKWFAMRNDYTLGGRREAWLGRVQCDVCGSMWASGLSWPKVDADLLSRLPVFRTADASSAQTLDAATLTARVAVIEAEIPALRGRVHAGMRFGRFIESREGRGPRAIKPVEWASMAGSGLVLTPSAVDALLRSGLVTEGDLVGVTLHPSRPDVDRYRELVVPFGATLDETSYEDGGAPCSGCRRRNPQPRWQSCVAAESMPTDQTTCRLVEWGTFLVREDLAAVLLSLKSPTLRFEPVEVVRGRRVRDARRRVVAFDTNVADAFLANARTSHELWHGAHLLSEARRSVAHMLVNPVMRRYPSWEQPTTFEIDGCAPPFKHNRQPALGVEGPVIMSYESHDYAGVERDLRNAAMSVGKGWGSAAGYAGDLAGVLLASSLSARDIGGWASDWLDVRFVETSGLPDIAAREALAKFTAGQTAKIETSSERPIRLGESVLKSRRHGAVIPSYRVREDEDLDALGFVRRFGESTVYFPSMARVAAQPWIEAIDAADIAALVDIAKETSTLGYASDCVSWMSSFRWDTELLFRERWPWLEQTTRERTKKDVRVPTPALVALLADRDPDPHVVVLVATVSDSVANDESLRAWAHGAFEVIEGASGAAVSATPHEVIGLLPVTTSIRAATALRLAFRGDPDALHVGLGIGRFDDPIHELHTRARGVAALPDARVAISFQARGAVEARELLDDTRLGAEPTSHVTPVAEMFDAARSALARARR